jgi:sialidase-1
MKIKLFLKSRVGLAFFTLLLIQCKSLDVFHIVHQHKDITLEQHYIPVLTGANNEVLELSIEIPVEKNLKEIQVSLQGEELLEGIRIYQISGKGEERQKIPVAAKAAAETMNNIQIRKFLPEGKHQFLISIIPKEGASLLKKVRIGVPEIILGNQRVKPLLTKPQLPLRLATKLGHHGDDGVHSFRIPGLATTTNGTLLAVYDVRRENSTDLQGDIDVGLNRSTDGGKTWEPMKIIMDMGEWGDKPQAENGIGDPAILVDHETNTIWVIALWAHGKPGEMLWNSSEAGMTPAETGQLMLVKSEDDGINWSEPINITSQIKDPKWKLIFNGPGKGITMRDGTLVFAGQFKDENDMPHSTLIYSNDKGKSWNIGTGAKSNTTEAQVVELNNGSLMLNMRDNRGGSRSVAVTSDLGQTWTEHSSSRSALIEPVSMASLITFPENRSKGEEASWLFFSNPAATDGRYNMTVKASEDQGISWPREHHILLDSHKSRGYSCLTVIDEEHLGILYESSQANITFQILKIQDIISENAP